jgi:uncharacterized protein
MPTIAIIGASADRSKFGNKAVRAYRLKGYDVYPVHPTAAEIEGLNAYRSIRDVPLESLDRVSIYLPPERGVTVLEDVAQKRVGEVWLNPGAESPSVLARARALGLNVIAGCSIVDIGVDPHQLD